MGRPKKEDSEKLTERLEIRAEAGTKLLLDGIAKYHGLKGYNAIVRFLAVKEARRIKLPTEPKEGQGIA